MPPDEKDPLGLRGVGGGCEEQGVRGVRRMKFNIDMTAQHNAGQAYVLTVIDRRSHICKRTATRPSVCYPITLSSALLGLRRVQTPNVGINKHAIFSVSYQTRTGHACQILIADVTLPVLTSDGCPGRLRMIKSPWVNDRA